MGEAFILGAVRTPMGRRNGGLARIPADELAAISLEALIERTGAPPERVEDVVMGCVTQIDEQGFNIARIAALIAGFPITTCGTSVNRQCGSSLQAMNFASHTVMAEQADLVIAAGSESMSRVPMGSDGGAMSDKLRDRFDIISQGLSAEMIAQKWDISREELDAFGLESHRRAVQAIDMGYFEREITPVSTVDANGDPMTVEVDEGPRRGTSLEKLAKLRPAFKEDGLITAGSSSQISDGSCAVLIGTKAVADELGLPVRAKIIATATAGVDPTIMLTGPIPATRKVLDKAGLTVGDIDLFEVNEAFASVVLAWFAEIGADPEKTNVNGGAIALGHPLGCSGVRLITTLLHEMERRDVRYGLATLCIGFGQAVATIIERNTA